MNLLDPKIIWDCKNKNIKNIFLYFYDSGCSGTKIDIVTDFDRQTKFLYTSLEDINVYVDEEVRSQLQDAQIIQSPKADHTWEIKMRYLFISKQVQDRCGCGSSFSFEKKVPKLNIKNLEALKNNYKK